MILMYEDDIAPLLEWSRRPTEKMPEPYLSWLRDKMPEACRARIEHHVGAISNRSTLDGEWVKGYPHIHAISMGWKPEVYTIITYLITPEEGGEFAMGGLNPDDPYTLIEVKPGLSIGCDAITWHGVKPVRKGVRVAIVSNGFPD